jgi:hypothetical protein
MPSPGLPLNAFIQQLYMQEYAARRLYKTYAVQERRSQPDTYGGYGDRSPNRYGNQSPTNTYPNRNYSYRSPNSYQNSNAYSNRPWGYGQSPRANDQAYNSRAPPPTPPRRSIMAPEDQRAPFQPTQANQGAGPNRQYG